MLKVLIVDDSAFARLSIAKTLTLDGAIAVAGFAKNGCEAIIRAGELKPDVIIMDVEMPVMNGLEALKHIMTKMPTPVIMIATNYNSKAALRSRELGAHRYFAKSAFLLSGDQPWIADGFVAEVKAAASERAVSMPATATFPEPPAAAHPSGRKKRADKVVVIASSTGGPGALYDVIPLLPEDLPAGLLLVQHMPPVFTKSLANKLNEFARIYVKEAEQNDKIFQGQALVSPGDFHMEVTRGGRISINQKPPVGGLRPSADITMASAAQVYGAASVAVILTGMGSDGTKGAGAIHAAGGRVIAQDEASCVVYGMPRSAAEAGVVHKIVPLKQIANEIEALCREIPVVGAR